MNGRDAATNQLQTQKLRKQVILSEVNIFQDILSFILFAHLDLPYSCSMLDEEFNEANNN